MDLTNNKFLTNYDIQTSDELSNGNYDFNLVEDNFKLLGGRLEGGSVLRRNS